MFLQIIQNCIVLYYCRSWCIFSQWKYDQFAAADVKGENGINFDGGLVSSLLVFEIACNYSEFQLGAERRYNVQGLAI